MNREESIALFERCEKARGEAKAKALAEGKSNQEASQTGHEAAKAIWNGEWAEPLLSERRQIQEARLWVAEKNPHGVMFGWNDVTRNWLSRAWVDFSGCRFYSKNSKIDNTSSELLVSDSQISSSICFCDEELDFRGFDFPSDTFFDRTSFHSRILFVATHFYGIASFMNSKFLNDACFSSSKFDGNTSFFNVDFNGDAWFSDADFNITNFSNSRFYRICSFSNARFLREARFSEAVFHKTCEFNSTEFGGDVSFADARFVSSVASFGETRFCGDVQFNDTQFCGGAWFSGSQFDGEALFSNAHFSGDVLFNSDRFRSAAQFYGDARFGSVKFDQLANFADTHFHGAGDFNAIRGERAYSLAEATFEQVPDFIQAHFEEAPRLDNVTVIERMVDPFPDLLKRKDDDGEEIEPTLTERWRHRLGHCYPIRWTRGAWSRYRRGLDGERDLKDIPARWRALKRLAVQAHDQDREHEFFARELRSNRFLHDWPLPFKRPTLQLAFLRWLNRFPIIFWSLSAWFSFGRFWAGVGYGLLSNYGRSALLPVFWWGVGVVIGAVLYFGAHQELIAERAKHRPWGEVQTGSETASLWDALWADGNHACYVSKAQEAEERLGVRELMRTPKTEIIGLSADLRAQSSAPREALQLALRDGFLILYGDADTAHRTYGCLYGVELYGGGTPVAIVPPQVANFSALHKLWSAVMIFLFGLALRNMLKMK